MKWTGFIAFGLAAVLQSSAGVAWAAPASREAVRAVLRGHEDQRMTAEDWRRLGDGVDVLLVEAAADPRLVFGARQKALGALGTLGGERAQEFLDRVVTARETPAPLLSTAIQAYARGFGKDERAQALGAGLLGHEDWQVRRGAVRALGTLRTAEARAAIRSHEAREPHPAVRAAMRSALAEGPASR